MTNRMFGSAKILKFGSEFFYVAQKLFSLLYHLDGWKCGFWSGRFHDSKSARITLISWQFLIIHFQPSKQFIKHFSKCLWCFRLCLVIKSVSNGTESSCPTGQAQFLPTGRAMILTGCPGTFQDRTAGQLSFSLAVITCFQKKIWLFFIKLFSQKILHLYFHKRLLPSVTQKK